MAVDRIYRGGFEGLEAYYTAKIERIELEKADARDAQFASVLSDVARFEGSRPTGRNELPPLDRSELRQPGASPALESKVLGELSGAQSSL